MGQIQLKGLSPQHFKLEFDGSLIGTLTLTKKGFSLFGHKGTPKVSFVKAKKTKPISTNESQARELLIKANQLGKAYRVARSKWHGGQGRRVPVARNCPFSSSDLQHLKRAVLIMQACAVTNYQLYIKAQIEGLRFVKTNGGSGVFPGIAALATDGAELRLLTYLKAEKDDNGDVVDLDISAEERNTPLTENGKYMTLRDKVLTGEATRLEAVYVMTLQVHRTGKVKPYVTEYMERLNADAEVEH